MTTFYRTANERRTVDCWAVPVASVRTEEILMVRQVEMAPPAPLSDPLPAALPDVAYT